MVDKDPVAQWTFGRVTFMGDAAHPMYPRGSNGSAQGLIDARTLAQLLATSAEPRAALEAYQQARLEPTARVVRTNRSTPPDFINIKVDELTGGKPFAGSGGLVAGPVTIAAALGGAVGGATSANVTDSKAKGALVGGLAGAGTGAAVMALVGLQEGNLGSILQGAITGALVGGITGSVGGVGGAMVAQKK